MELTTADKDLADNLVVQSNDLLVAVCSMTLKEKQVFLACISQVDSRKTLEEGKRFVLTVEQAHSLFYTDKTKSNAYRDLKTVADRLFERTAVIRLSETKTLKTRFVQSVIFDDETDSISILFADDIKPYISALESDFTKYKLAQVQQITNKNAVRLFELCTMWLGQANTPYVVKMFELDELRELLGQLGSYKQFGQLKTMLTKAVQQLNESTDISVKLAYKKQRASYKYVQLKIAKTMPQQEPINSDRDPNTIDWVDELADNTKRQTWRNKGLTEGQIKKIAVHMKEFVDANSSRLSANDRRDYAPIFEEWKTLLKDPNEVGSFHKVQELLDRQRS